MFGWLFNREPEDNREDYVRDESGNAWALLVSGEEYESNWLYDVFDTPQHENYIHDGTPHQNPAVIERYEWRWFLFIPYRVRVQERYYPLTLGSDGTMPNLDRIQQRLQARRLRSGQRAQLVPMNERIERQAWKREDLTQRLRGVRRLRRRGQL